MRDLLTLVEQSPEPSIPVQPDPPQMITLTENAVSKIKDLLAEENNPKLKLRVFVQGGGCSGMQYGFTMDEDQSEDDFDLEFDTIHVLIDSMSSTYLESAEIDWKEDQYGASFSIKNPQAQTSCGCGSSFSPY
jgi:iron-sulfur cluster insertion protein